MYVEMTENACALFSYAFYTEIYVKSCSAWEKELFSSVWGFKKDIRKLS